MPYKSHKTTYNIDNKFANNDLLMNLNERTYITYKKTQKKKLQDDSSIS